MEANGCRVVHARPLSGCIIGLPHPSKALGIVLGSHRCSVPGRSIDVVVHSRFRTFQGTLRIIYNDEEVDKLFRAGLGKFLGQALRQAGSRRPGSHGGTLPSSDGTAVIAAKVRRHARRGTPADSSGLSCFSLGSSGRQGDWTTDRLFVP